MRTGRPIKGTGAKKWRLNLRLGNDTQKIIEYLIEKTGDSKTDIIENSLKMYYNFRKSID